jgi:hypothetical protein
MHQTGLLAQFQHVKHVEYAEIEAQEGLTAMEQCPQDDGYTPRNEITQRLRKERASTSPTNMTSDHDWSVDHHRKASIEDEACLGNEA